MEENNFFACYHLEFQEAQYLFNWKLGQKISQSNFGFVQSQAPRRRLPFPSAATCQLQLPHLNCKPRLGTSIPTIIPARNKIK